MELPRLGHESLYGFHLALLGHLLWELSHLAMKKQQDHAEARYICLAGEALLRSQPVASINLLICE